ncbi:hypothetical protein [Rhodococcus sp. X156]|uniref:hypothetical protein n=1 Tax=Rhodococcus sp. X156 TaxID=2499145 RepID=UPI000FD82373|nr:hypothetical protein [Rhodococcus sp. X156]
MSERVTLRDSNGLYVWAEILDDGVLQIAGQDLGPPQGLGLGSEYEYWLTVQPDEISLVVAALGGAEGDDVLPLLQANGDQICQTGEQKWLTSLGIEPGFFSYSSMD